MKNKLELRDSLLGLSDSELEEEFVKLKKIDSSCFFQILDQMQEEMFPKLLQCSFEEGIGLNGLYKLEFKPNRFLLSYYPLIESKIGL